MLQEEGQSVGFGPTYLCYVHHPWYVNLFTLYLAILPLFAVVRTARIVWALRRRRIASQPELQSELSAPRYWALVQIKARSFTNLSHLTILISILILALSLSHAFNDLATQKIAGVGPIAWSVADALATFAQGIVIAIGLFCMGLFCERMIRRRKFAVGDEIKRFQSSAPDSQL